MNTCPHCNKDIEETKAPEIELNPVVIRGKQYKAVHVEALPFQEVVIEGWHKHRNLFTVRVPVLCIQERG